jgi:hypothetical protein
MWVLSRDRQQKSITLEPCLKANNVFAVRDAAITGHGIALLRCPISQPKPSISSS